MLLKKLEAGPGKTIGLGQLSLAAGMVCFFTAMVLGRHGVGGVIGADNPGAGSIALIAAGGVLLGVSLPLNIRGLREFRKARK